MDISLPIGIFDSGVGGLTVLKALENLLPHENFLYLGDTARVPYGTKSRETIIRYTLTVGGKLLQMGIKALVIACNTATSAALPAAAAKFAPIPVLGVIEPGARAATAATINKHIAVIGTEATINGKAYQQAIQRLAPQTRISAKACTLLVPLAEEGWLDGPVAESVITRYLDDIIEPADFGGPDTLLLGCTHFPLFRNTLRKILGPDIKIVDSAKATAEHAKQCLCAAKLLNNMPESGHTRFFTTDHRERFAQTGSLFLERCLTGDDVELLDL